MEVHEAVAEQLEHGECGRAAVDELAIRAGGGKDALQNELRVFARLHALFFEPRVEGRVVLHGEDRLDRAALGAGADERLVRAFAEDDQPGGALQNKEPLDGRDFPEDRLAKRLGQALGEGLELFAERQNRAGFHRNTTAHPDTAPSPGTGGNARGPGGS